MKTSSSALPKHPHALQPKDNAPKSKPAAFKVRESRKEGGLNWDEVPMPTKRERARMEHIHEALRKAFLRENGTNPLPNADQWAAELKVSRQTIYSTIQNMEIDYSMPIEYVPERFGYRYTEDVVGTPFCKLSEGEVLAVYLSHEMLSAFHKMPLKKKAQSAFRKIIEQSGQVLSFDAAMVEEGFSITPSGHPAYYHPKHFEICCRAVLRSEDLVLDYTKMHGEGAHVPELRRVRPLHLTFHEFAWYLLCWDLKAEDYRCYMLTRMNALKETGVKFVRPKNFNAQKILRKNFAIFTSGEPVDVALEFSPKVARMMQEREWHKTQKLTPRPDGSVGITMRVAITPDLILWIAGYMDDCRILGPIELRKDVSKRQELASQGHWLGPWGSTENTPPSTNTPAKRERASNPPAGLAGAEQSAK